MNNLPADHCEHGFDAFDLFLWQAEIIVGERHQIGELTGIRMSFLTIQAGVM